jgi:DNA-binding MarR family transcriptional regulator
VCPDRHLRSAENTVHDLIAIGNDLRRHIRADLAARGYSELRPSFAPLLTRIWRGPVPQGRLADALGVSPQAASQTVGSAEQAGYVRREPNPDDGRSKLVALTPLGRAFVADGGAAIAARAADYATYLGSRRFARFDGALARLKVGLGLDDTGPVAPLTPATSVMAAASIAAHAVASLRTAMEEGGHRGIGGTQNLVLVHIGPHGARSIELARAKRISRQAVSATLHELESLGYVTRHDDPSDARGVIFRPTRLGRSALGTYVAGIDGLEARYEAVLGAARFAALAGSADELCTGIRSCRALADPRFVGGDGRAVARER